MEQQARNEPLLLVVRPAHKGEIKASTQGSSKLAEHLAARQDFLFHKLHIGPGRRDRQ